MSGVSREHTKTAWRLALGLSLTLHALSFLAVRDVLKLPHLALEFELPSEAEFGVIEEPSEPAAAAESKPAEPPAAPPEPAPNKAAAAPEQPPKPKAPKTELSEVPLPAALAAAGGVAKLAPKGSQLALRMDLERIRNHPLADDVALLLRAIPDVRALLDGSGVDPVRDLSRLFLASPDLRRPHVVMAGKYTGDESVPRTAVERLAQLKGVAAPWRVKRGIRVAPWQNADATERVVALLGPGTFAITRPDDLPRVLAVARALNAKAARVHSANDDAGEALVHMAERELINVAVENARSFVRGARAQLAPEQLEISIREQAEDKQLLDLTSSASYPDEDQAQNALQYWEKLRAQYASHPLVALMNLDRLLKDLKLSRDGTTLTAALTVPQRQARLLLRFLRDSVRGPEPDAPLPTKAR